MIAVDTNILVHAHRKDAVFHTNADAKIRELARSRAGWGIVFHCLVEFYAVTTNPRVWRVPSSPRQATEQIAAWCEAPSLALLDDSRGSGARLWSLVAHGAIVGAKVHDARIAAVCLDHGVEALWSIDRDFSRFPELTVVNPIVAIR